MTGTYRHCQRHILDSVIHLGSRMAKKYHANMVLMPDKTDFKQNVTTQKIFCNDKSLERHTIIKR